MASAECKPITGVWRRSPQQGQWAEPLVRELEGAKPPEGDIFQRIGHTKEGANWPHVSLERNCYATKQRLVLKKFNVPILLTACRFYCWIRTKLVV